jgi:F-type H+-transporting ATPase subunit epsilon
MAENKLTLKIYNPSGLQLETEVDSVYFQSSEGQIGILDQHVAYAGTLGIGILEYKTAAERSTQRCVVSEGLCQVNKNVLSILADAVDFPASIDLSKLEDERLKLMEKARMAGLEKIESDLIARKIERVTACQKMLSN